MRLIDNKKDYYDYLAGIQGIVEYITYDRRDSVRLHNKSNQEQLEIQYPWWPIVFCPYKDGVLPSKRGTSAEYISEKWDKNYKSKEYPDYYSARSFTVGILIGFKLYIIEVDRLLKNETDTTAKLIPNLVCIKDYDRRNKDLTKNIEAPIVIGEIANHSYYTWQLPLRERKSALNNAEKYRDADFKVGCYPWNGPREKAYDVLENPIMADTWIPSVIPAEEVWNNVTDYLLAMKEKPIVDNRTDVQHAEAAGFDKKTSFRNM